MNRGPQKKAAKKIANHFESEKAAKARLAAIRWTNGNGEVAPICPKCGSAEGAYTLTDGRYRCKDKDCRTSFTVTTGTVFESSHIPLHKWMLAVYLLCSSKKGISSHQLHRMMGVTYKTAWFMTHRIREAMREGSFAPPLGGKGKIVEIDETHIGRNPWRSKQPKERGPAHKLKVLSLVERGGKARSFYVERARMKDLLPIIHANVHRDSEIMTDEAGTYNLLGTWFKKHDAVRHGAAEYVRYESGRVVSSNTIEGFFSIFKRGMTGV